MTTILTDKGDFTVAATNGLTVTAEDAERVAGWTLKPEGMCRGDLCVPLPVGMSAGGRVDLAAFWTHLGNPVVSDAAKETFVLGAGSDERNAGLVGLQAPDITLPDLNGLPHSLSSLQGRKVLLTTWASW